MSESIAPQQDPEITPISTDEAVTLFIDEINNNFSPNGVSVSAIRNPDQRALTEHEYKELCQQYLESDEPLNNEHLSDLIKYLENDFKFEIHFPEGNKCCLAIVPFSEAGNKLEKNEINHGKHIRLLIIDKRGQTVGGFSPWRSYISELLPSSVQSHAISIGSHKDPNNRARIIREIESAYSNLQSIINTTPKSYRGIKAASLN
jgi:hypothetical protein